MVFYYFGNRFFLLKCKCIINVNILVMNFIFAMCELRSSIFHEVQYKWENTFGRDHVK